MTSFLRNNYYDGIELDTYFEVKDWLYPLPVLQQVYWIYKFLAMCAGVALLMLCMCCCALKVCCCSGSKKPAVAQSEPAKQAASGRKPTRAKLE